MVVLQQLTVELIVRAALLKFLQSNEAIGVAS
jgi:hypothetical protein